MSTTIRYQAVILAIFLAPLAWVLPRPAIAPSLALLGITALAEEVIFRMFLQDALRKKLARRNATSPHQWYLPSVSNLIASALFALVHLVNHPPLWALATFFPSLIFGLLWDRHRSVLLCGVVHFIYNVSYFYQPF